MADEIIRRGYCVNDTSIVSQTDTLIIETITYLPDTLDLTPECYIDTILPSGTRITIVDNQLIIKEKSKNSKEIIHTVTTNYVRDKALEDIMSKDLEKTKDSLENSRSNVIILKGINKEHTDKIVKLHLRFWGLLAALALYTLVRIYLKLKPGF
jgi:hypothetical protein